jgi:hypothetical protein
LKYDLQRSTWQSADYAVVVLHAVVKYLFIYSAMNPFAVPAPIIQKEIAALLLTVGEDAICFAEAHTWIPSFSIESLLTLHLSLMLFSNFVSIHRRETMLAQKPVIGYLPHYQNAIVLLSALKAIVPLFLRAHPTSNRRLYISHCTLSPIPTSPFSPKTRIQQKESETITNERLNQYTT